MVATVHRNYTRRAKTCHDSAVAIVDASGSIVYAEATEPFLQSKRALNSPPDTFLRIDELIAAHCDPRAELVLAYSWSDASPSAVREEMRRVGELRRLSLESGKAAPEFAARALALFEFVQR